MQRVLSLGAVVGMVAILFPGLVGAETRAVRPAQDAMGPDISVVNLSSGDVSFRITVPADYSVTRSEERPFPEARMNPPYRYSLITYCVILSMRPGAANQPFQNKPQNGSITH